MEKILEKLIWLVTLFKKHGPEGFRLLFSTLLKRPLWIRIQGEKIWLNQDAASNYHLVHSVDKLQKLVASLPVGLEGAVIDGGANHGIFSMLAARRFPEKQVYAIEPYHRVLPFLEKNVAGKKVRIIKKALAASDGVVRFYTAPSSDQVGSTIRDNVEVFTTTGAAIVENEVPAISLKTMVKEEGISKIAVLKLDVQGAEFSILQQAEAVLSITECLALEVVLIEKTAIELLEFAKKRFPYHQIINPLPYGADIIFAKKPI
jgi:FkbM family methyltransferase